jgi:hypothetical protein
MQQIVLFSIKVISKKTSTKGTKATPPGYLKGDSLNCATEDNSWHEFAILNSDPEQGGE